MKSNISLYFYGLWAKVIQLIGIFIILLGFFLALKSIVYFFICLILGIIIILLGKAERFDYQRQSGYIVHKGD